MKESFLCRSLVVNISYFLLLKQQFQKYKSLYPLQKSHIGILYPCCRRKINDEHTFKIDQFFSFVSMSTQSLPCQDSYNVWPKCCGYLQLTAHSPPLPHITMKATRHGDAEGQQSPLPQCRTSVSCFVFQKCLRIRLWPRSQLGSHYWIHEPSLILPQVSLLPRKSTSKSTHHATVSGSARHASSTSQCVG